MTQKKKESSSKGKKIAFFLGILVSATLLFFAAQKLDFPAIGHEILTMNWLALVFAVLMANVHNFLLAKRWHLLLKPIHTVGYWDAFWSLRISFFFNASLPARLGEPFRVFYLTRRTGISAAKSIGAMGADRFLDFITMAALLYLSAVVLGVRGTMPPLRTIAIATLIGIALFTILMKLPSGSEKSKVLHKIWEFRARVFEGLLSLRRGHVLFPAVAISFLGWIVEATIVVGLSYGVDAQISLFKAFMVVAAITLAISIPSTPGNFGTFELGAIAMLRFFGVHSAEAATIAILYHMVQLIPTLVIGAYGYHFHFLAQKKTRHHHNHSSSDSHKAHKKLGNKIRLLSKKKERTMTNSPTTDSDSKSQNQKTFVH